LAQCRTGMACRAEHERNMVWLPRTEPHYQINKTTKNRWSFVVRLRKRAREKRRLGSIPGERRARRCETKQEQYDRNPPRLVAVPPPEAGRRTRTRAATSEERRRERKRARPSQQVPSAPRQGALLIKKRGRRDGRRRPGEHAGERGGGVLQ
jgi:hypothetical protein